MPIIEKIDLAKRKYAASLKNLQAYASEGVSEPDFEKKMVSMLLDMLEIKKEIDILEKVNSHRQS